MNIMPIAGITQEERTMSKYAAEGHAGLDEVVALEPGYAQRFDALTWDHRHSIALSIEAECVTFMNEQHRGEETTFPTLNDAMLAAAEGQLTEEESNARNAQEQTPMGKYAAESHAELDEVIALAPGYERRFDALTWDQRHTIVLSIEAEILTFLNEQHRGEETTFPTLNDAMLAAAEGQLTEEESNAR